MDSLDDYEALELFSLYAFGERHPTKDFASQIVKYMQGHPLALKVIGRLLENKDFASSVLDRSHCSANAIIEVLADNMAREIIREEFRQNHRGLWISSEEYDVNKVTQEVEVLVLMLKKNCQNIPINGQALTRMKNLLILKICFPKVKGRWQPFAVNFPRRVDSLSNKLRHIKHLWTTPKCLRRLKFMKLRYCLYLTSTPECSKITNLEELILKGCKKLVKVHPSIGMLKKLLVLNMRDCTCLKSFPSNLEMDSLRILILSVQVPKSIGGLSCLKDLYLEGNNFASLPKSLGQLFYLRVLDVHGCKKLDVLTELPHTLQSLHARDCTSLRSFTGSSKDPITINTSSYLGDCPKLFTNLAIDSCCRYRRLNISTYV
nr:hypothetical protein [Tanacetum cinerariifolium]